MMIKRGFAATVLTASAVALAAPAMAAPDPAGTARDTISSLELQGYLVVVNRLSERPLAAADVVSVSKSVRFNRIQWNPTDQSGRRYSAVSTPTVYVSVR